MKKKENAPILRVALYLRVSTSQQAREGDSIREQLESLTEYINKQNNMILHDTYIDNGYSGQKLNRDEFTRLINDVKAGLIDHILFTKLDRWFRSLRHYLNTQALLEKYNVTWTAIHQSYYNTSTAHGRAFVAQSMTWAELEAQNDSERILAVFENKVKNGEVISGTKPLGYDIVNKHLVPNDEAWKVQKIFEFYAQTGNMRALIQYAAEDLKVNRHYSTLKRIIQSEKYKGSFRGNPNYCEPLVSTELWEECNRLLARNQRQNKNHDYIFSGLLKCGTCGHHLSAATHANYYKGEKRPAYLKPDGSLANRSSIYLCNRHRLSLDCTNKKSFYESTIEKKLLATVKTELEQYLADYEVTTAPITNNASKKKSIQKKIEKLKELFINDLITIDEYKQDKAKFEQELAQLPDIEYKPKDLTYIKKALSMDFESIYKTMTINEKNAFWRSFIDYIVVDEQRNLEIHFL